MAKYDIVARAPGREGYIQTGDSIELEGDEKVYRAGVIISYRRSPRARPLYEIDVYSQDGSRIRTTSLYLYAKR